MMKLPNDNEVRIIGNWVKKSDGSVEGDQYCDRIQWLTDAVFELIKVDGDNWSALYKNPNDGKLWELTYPQSHLHGGGPPSLETISDTSAFEKYEADNVK